MQEWKNRPSSLKNLEQIGAELERLSNVHSVALDTFLASLGTVIEANPELADAFAPLRPQIQDLRDLDVLLANRALVNFDLISKTSKKIVLDSMPIDGETFKRYWHVRPTRNLFPHVRSIEGFRKVRPDYKVIEQQKRKEEEEKRRFEREEHEKRIREEEEMRRIRAEEDMRRMRAEEELRLRDEERRRREEEEWRYRESRKRAHAEEDGRGDKRSRMEPRDYLDVDRERSGRRREEHHEYAHAQVAYERDPRREDRGGHYGQEPYAEPPPQRGYGSGYFAPPGGPGTGSGPGPSSSSAMAASPTSKRTVLMSEVERLLGVVQTSMLSSNRGGRPE